MALSAALPGFVRPQEATSPQSAIDALYNAYIMNRQMKQADLSQGIGLASQGIDPSAAGLPPNQIYGQLIEQFKAKRAQQAQSDTLALSGKEYDIKKTQAEIAKLQAEAGSVGKPDVKTQLNTENTLRDELNKLSGDFIKIRDSFSRIQSVAKQPSAAGDLALIFNYMKILDPGSTVREGEFATAQNSGSVPSRIVAAYNKVLAGERLSESQRQDFLFQAQNQYSSQLDRQKQLEGEYGRIAQGAGARPGQVIVDRAIQLQQQIAPPSGPAVGSIEDGYRFKGGNPSDPANWEKL